jgi:hypothetical protein
LLYVISKLCLRFSAIVCDTQFMLILFFCLFWTNVQSKRTTRAEPKDHLWSADHSLRNIVVADRTASVLPDKDLRLTLNKRALCFTRRNGGFSKDVAILYLEEHMKDPDWRGRLLSWDFRGILEGTWLIATRCSGFESRLSRVHFLCTDSSDSLQ